MVISVFDANLIDKSSVENETYILTLFDSKLIAASSIGQEIWRFYMLDLRSLK